MRLPTRYLAVGTAWAVLLGPLVCIALVGSAAGIAWVMIFGDDPWPESTQWVLPAIGLAGGVTTAVACIVLGYRYGKIRETSRRETTPAEKRKIVALTVAPLTALLMLAGVAWVRMERYEHAMTLAASREAAFARLMGTRHEIAEIVIEQTADGMIRANIGLTAGRQGPYRLSWHVTAPNFRGVLLDDSRSLNLKRDGRSLVLTFAVGQLARSYQALVLKGRGGVLVEEPFRLDVTLEPDLAAADYADLPPGERYRLRAGQSPLRSKASVNVPVRFLIRRDGTLVR